MTRRRGMPWIRMALIAVILYVAGILVLLAVWVLSIQRGLVEGAWQTGNALLVLLAVAAAVAMGLFGWLLRLARRV